MGEVIALFTVFVFVLAVSGAAVDFLLYGWLVGKGRSRTVRIVGLTIWGAAHIGVVVFAASR